MALAKVCGIETEYGIVVSGAPDANPITTSSQLVNAYVSELSRGAQGGRVAWDFQDEHPSSDARGFTQAGANPPEVESHQVNTVLTNGARFYVDHAHPEYSGPECRTALEAALFDAAGDEVLRRAMAASRWLFPPGHQIVVYKNNSDGKGNSYGTHENYLMDRKVPFGRIAQAVTAFFVTRQVFCGAGKVGSELAGVPCDFQISQRADFFEEEVGLETTLKRPIVNTRDEPHAESSLYRRFHVIVGDANMSEVATYLKVGTTAIVLSMIEDGVFDNRSVLDRFLLAAPVQAIRVISHDPSLRLAVGMADGRTATALDIQWELLRLAKDWSMRHGLDSVGPDIGDDVLIRWELVLEGLEKDPASVADTVDWVAKRRIVEGYQDRHGLAPNSAALRAIDLQYHDLRPERSLAARAGLATLHRPDEARAAADEPPRTTRAYFRGKCLQRFGRDIAAANWDSIVFDLGNDPLRRVPMFDPLRGTAEHVDSLLEGCATASELLARLGA